VKVTAGLIKEKMIGSAIASSGRKAGCTTAKLYSQLAKFFPSELLSRQEFKRWNKGRPGTKTKKLVSLYQTIKKLDVDGRVGRDTWGSLKQE